MCFWDSNAFEEIHNDLLSVSLDLCTTIWTLNSERKPWVSLSMHVFLFFSFYFFLFFIFSHIFWLYICRRQFVKSHSVCNGLFLTVKDEQKTVFCYTLFWSTSAIVLHQWSRHRSPLNGDSWQCQLLYSHRLVVMFSCAQILHCIRSVPRTEVCQNHFCHYRL